MIIAFLKIFLVFTSATTVEPPYPLVPVDGSGYGLLEIMGYEGCKFGFCSSRKLEVWVMRVYWLREVWVKRGSTVAI